MDRRAFLLALGAALAACTDSSDDSGDPAPTADGPTATPATDSSTTVSSTASTATTSTSDPTVDPLDAPAIELADDAFALGVASGEPDHTSVVLWTRIPADRIPAEATVVPVVWEVARDPSFTTIVATGIEETDADLGHSVHAIATGLAAGTSYHYRFRAGEQTSTAGRTRTMLSPSSDDAVRLGVSSCQRATDGTYRAHADLAEADVDVVVWLGDYIYGQATTLDEYRSIYAEYRTNPELQACHAAHPWFVIADDHEVANDYDASVDPQRRSAAFRAWWENQATRLPPPDPDSTEPHRLHRRVDIGRQLRIVLTDTRQYADATSLFGAEQLSFIEESLRGAQRWTVVASSVLASGISVSSDEVLLPYTLDAHPDERALLASWLADTPNPLIVSGDLHAGMVLDFSADPTDRDAPAVATEFMAPAISSSFPEDLAPFAPFLPLLNPHVQHVDVTNGWMQLTIDRDQAVAEYRTVRDVDDLTSRIDTRQFVVPAG